MLRFHALFPKKVPGFLSGHAGRQRPNGQPGGVGFPQGQQQSLFPGNFFDFPHTDRQFFPGFFSLFHSPCPGQVKGNHHRIGRTGGAKQGHGLFGPFCKVQLSTDFRVPDIQKRTAGEHRQGFMSGTGRQVCSQCQRMLSQKGQMGTVGIIHQQRHSMSMTNGGKALNIRQHPIVIGAGDIDCFCVRIFRQCFFHILRVKPAGQTGPGIRPGTHPHRFDSQQGHGIYGAAVNDPAGNHLPALWSRQPEHGLNAEGAASGGKISGPAVEQLPGCFLSRPDTSVGFKQAVGVRQLRQV